jgi:hypothetical protein
MWTHRLATTYRITRLLLLSSLLGVVGCRATHNLYSDHTYGVHNPEPTDQECLAAIDSQIERGEPRMLLDGVARIVAIPSKIILWNRRIDNHNVSLTTESAVAEYLERNQLDEVKVRINQYAPGDEWHRLTANTSVGWGWRYSAGTLSWLQDTLLPGRLVGGDHYNPFTNTINLYSDIPAVALHEAAHAKDFAQRNYKGTYAVHEAIASRDALAYVRAFRPASEEQEACRILYPAYGTYVGGAAASFLPWNSTWIYAGAVIPGHLLGRYRANQVARERGAMEVDYLEREDQPDRVANP